MSDLPYIKQSAPVVFVLILVGFGIASFALGPSWERARMKARASECPVNLHLIADRQERVRAQTGSYLACPKWPPQVHPEGIQWGAGETKPPECWPQLGFESDIRLRGQYEVLLSAEGYLATCRVDLDGDGKFASFQTTDLETPSQLPGSRD